MQQAMIMIMCSMSLLLEFFPKVSYNVTFLRLTFAF